MPQFLPAAKSDAVLLAHALRLSGYGLAAGRVREWEDELANRLRVERPGLTEDDASRVVGATLDLARQPLDSLHILAERLVVWDAGAVVAPPGRLENRLRQLVDVDTLVCWKLAGRPPPNSRAEELQVLGWPPVLPPARSRFAPLLGRPMAETHCHLGSTLTPSLLWVFALSGAIPLPQVFPEPDEPIPFFDGWVVRLRSALRALSSLMGGAQYPDLTDIDLVMPTLASWVAQSWSSSAAWRTPSLWPLGAWEVDGRTTLSTLAGERLLLWRTMQQIRRQGPNRPAKLDLRSPLLDYICIKNTFQQALFYRPFGRGLRPFQRTFDRRSFYFKPVTGPSRRQRKKLEQLEYRRMRQCLELFLDDAAGPGRWQDAPVIPDLDLELRVTPQPGSRTAVSLRAWLRAMHDTMTAYRDPPIRVGLVFHLLKLGGPTWQADCQFLLEGLWSLLDDWPAMRKLVVGFDIAGPERFRAPREYARFFLSFREKLDGQTDGRGATCWRPGLTVHAGEDCVDLLTGLRHVDETTHLLGLLPNDRLGHALAVGWPAKAFYEGQDAPVKTVQEHLMDLLWAGWLAGQNGSIDSDAVRTIEQGLRDVWKIVGTRPTPDAVAQVTSNIEAVSKLEGTERDIPWTEPEVLFPLGLPSGALTAKLTISRNDTEYHHLVTQVQAVVWRRVYKAGLVIEGNPTSNLLLGRFADYADLPLVRQGRAPGVENSIAPDLPRLRVTINTDNPGIFQTTLRSEYLRVGEGLLSRPGDNDGVDAQAIANWLDDRRKAGVDSTFIPREVPRGRGFHKLLALAWSRGQPEPPPLVTRYSTCALCRLP